MIKEFVLLTKSKKFGAYCIAGIDLLTNEWIRIVTPNGGAIEKKDTCYENGEEAQILDIIEVECSGRDRVPFQPENYVIKSKSKWVKKGKASVQLLRQKAGDDEENKDKVFYNTSHLISADSINKVEQSRLYSLMIIKIHNPYLILNKDNGGSIPKGKLSFYYKGERYNYFRITDTDYLESCPNQDYMGTMSGYYYVVVSLGEKFPHDNCHYKLVAKIFKCC